MTPLDLAFVTLVVMAGRPEGAMLKTGPQTSKEHGVLGVCPLGFLYMISKLNLWTCDSESVLAIVLAMSSLQVVWLQWHRVWPTILQCLIVSCPVEMNFDQSKAGIWGHISMSSKKNCWWHHPSRFYNCLTTCRNKKVVSQHILDSKMFADKVYLP